MECSICLDLLIRECSSEEMETSIGLPPSIGRGGQVTDNLEPDPAEVCVTHCGHIFHRKCLMKWLQINSLTCPTCRSMVFMHALRRVFLSQVQKNCVNCDKLKKECEALADECKYLNSLLVEQEIHNSKSLMSVINNARVKSEKLVSDHEATKSELCNLREQVRSLEKKVRVNECKSVCTSRDILHLNHRPSIFASTVDDDSDCEIIEVVHNY